MEELIIIGAGPCGLSAAIEAKKRGLRPLVIEKGCIVNSIYHFPVHMQFFSTPELLEIGGVPFITSGKPSRMEALKYYRATAEAYDLNIHTYERVTGVDRDGETFRVHTEKKGESRTYTTSRLVLSTGYYDSPNRLDVPGGDLPKVHHYYKEGHPYNGLDVLVIGGKNSAVDTAMDLHEAGARVTMVYHRDAFSDSVKPWVKPVIESALRKGWIKMHWNTRVKEIRENEVVLEKAGETFSVANDAVFAMIGYHPQTEMLSKLGVKVDPETGAPVHNPETMETEVPGLYIAGVIAAGWDANSIFIENGRYHGEKIANHIQRDAMATS
ncbi:thioredoxin reductase (NADPH) [Melghirimyces thermohalophilus]|uniref:Thioredoxin reductase (NADPH) n=1 Tax=Melghirimyces thermohalophilus TaxID=1236220 RepID=A0A1G6LPX6_9BACL|nr:YpdA family putative bacillithiol disulfide reductase [Melghirimyces thermohalophilus]SDC45251.1 thioredoxin reductase (NADPH) [Melghirimyces thermohalophilus]